MFNIPIYRRKSERER